MPLTPAERMKKYREKLKNDPAKYVAKKKKHAEYVKSKNKKISELSDEEKARKRKVWREQKRHQKQKKEKLRAEETVNEERTTCSKAMKKESSTKKRCNNVVVKKYNLALKRIRALKRIVNRYKQKLHRQKKETDEKILKLEHNLDIVKARNELMESTLKSTYTKCQSQKEKKVFKEMVVRDEIQAARKKTYVANILGLKGKIRLTRRRQKEDSIKKEIEKFYVRDDITRITAGKRECRTLGKDTKQIRYLTDTLLNLYKIYREEGGKRSFSTFYKYKPFYVLTPNIQNRETCLCAKHNNTEMMLYALKKNKVFFYPSMSDILKELCCDLKSEECMMGNCPKCEGCKLKYNLEPGKAESQTEWYQWERVNHEYQKTDKGIKKTVATKKTVKLRKSGTVAELIDIFEKNIPIFKKHYFIWLHQQRQYQICIQNLTPNEILIVCDFSENYVCKLSEEIQATHFGASKNQITLHTGMVYMGNKEAKSFCTISDNNSHEPPAIWAHLIPVLRYVKEMMPETKVVHVYSDGPTSQYRQKKNFYLLNLLTTQMGFEYSTWSFTEAGHGKGVADGIGGSTKRALDRQVAFGKDITNGSDAYDILNNCMISVKCWLVSNSDIENFTKIVPDNLTPIVGTMQIHQIVSSSADQIQYRNLSCFCGVNRGLCNCYSLKTHIFKEKDRKIIKKNRTVEVDLNETNEVGSEIVIPLIEDELKLLTDLQSIQDKPQQKVTYTLPDIQDSNQFFHEEQVLCFSYIIHPTRNKTQQ